MTKNSSLRFKYLSSLISGFDTDTKLIHDIESVAGIFIKCLKSGGKLIFAGNGGSAAEAQHMAGEYLGRFAINRPSMASISLSTDTSTLTAIANDYGYENVFSRQIEGLGNTSDVFIGYSTSGQSQNIINAFQKATEMGITNVGFTGKNTDTFKPYCKTIVSIPSEDTPTIQECHLIIGHIISGQVEEMLYGDINS